MTKRILILAPLAVLLAACGPADIGEAESSDATSVEVAAATNTAIVTQLDGLPDAVLDGTEVIELSGFEVSGFNDSAAGEYSVDQGGAILSVSLAETADGWQLARIHEEPGWPTDEAVYELRQEAGVLRSEDGSVTVALSSDGLLVLESGTDVVPPDLWVLYRRTP